MSDGENVSNTELSFFQPLLQARHANCLQQRGKPWMTSSKLLARAIVVVVVSNVKQITVTQNVGML